MRGGGGGGNIASHNNLQLTTHDKPKTTRCGRDDEVKAVGSGQRGADDMASEVVEVVMVMVVVMWWCGGDVERGQGRTGVGRKIDCSVQRDSDWFTHGMGCAPLTPRSARSGATSSTQEREARRAHPRYAGRDDRAADGTGTYE